MGRRVRQGQERQALVTQDPHPAITIGENHIVKVGREATVRGRLDESASSARDLVTGALEGDQSWCPSTAGRPLPACVRIALPPHASPHDTESKPTSSTPNGYGSVRAFSNAPVSKYQARAPAIDRINYNTTLVIDITDLTTATNA
jgi:hypothetical protein